MTEYKKIFLDTSPLIYLLEEVDSFYEKVQNFLSNQIQAELTTSTITIMEYLILPFRENKKDLVENFYNYLSDLEIEPMLINQEIAEKAAQIRATYKSFKAMDCLQLASALHSNCEAFLTNDLQLKQFTELEILCVSELSCK